MLSPPRESNLEHAILDIEKWRGREIKRPPECLSQSRMGFMTEQLFDEKNWLDLWDLAETNSSLAQELLMRNYSLSL